MINKLQEIHNLLPDNDNAEITEGKVREAFSKTFDFVTEQNTTQDTAIAGKLDKTTTTITEPNAEFKYAYLTNEANQTRRMLAGDLGKNVANSKPTSVAGAGLNMGAIWDINTNGFPLRIKGLENKKSDPTHNLKVKMNADGQLSVSDEADVVFQMPESATITVNHIYPPKIPDRPSFADAIIEAFERAKNKNWTIWGKSDISIIDNDKLIDEFVTFSNNGYLIIRTNNLSENIHRVKLFSNRKFSDTDSFQLRFEVNEVVDPVYNGGNIHTGLGYPMLEDIRADVSTGGYSSFFGLGDGSRDNLTIFFTKVNDIIYISGYRKDRIRSMVVNTSPELGEMAFKILINKGSRAIVRLSYKDLNN